MDPAKKDMFFLLSGQSINPASPLSPSYPRHKSQAVVFQDTA